MTPFLEIWEVWFFLHYQYSQAHSDPKLPVREPTMSEIDLFEIKNIKNNLNDTIVCKVSKKYLILYIYIYIDRSSSSSTCHATCTDIPDSLSLLLPIFHSFWQVLRAKRIILTELLIALLLIGHVRGSIGEHHLCDRPCSSSSVLHVCFV